MDIFIALDSGIACQNWSEVVENLIDLTKRLHDETFRSEYGKEVYKCANTHIQTLCPKVLEISKGQLLQNECKQYLKTLLECFRALRNTCAGSRDNQDLIFEHPAILTGLLKLFEILTESSKQNGVVEVLRCAVQFLGNLCVGNNKTQTEVWKQFLPSISLIIKDVEDIPLTNYCCMVVHTCLLSGSEFLITTHSAEFNAIITVILDNLTQTDLEWGLLVIEDILLMPSYLETISHSLGNKDWIFLVEVMINVLKEAELNKVQPIHISNINYLCTEIINNSYQILSVNTDTDFIQQKSLLLCKMIEVLGIATSSLPDGYSTIQQNTELLTSAINLLKGISEIGRSGSSVFSSVEKLSDINQVNTEHPVYGLKRDIVRLIANMANKHRANQHTVRELDGIPLLLDQSNMDGKNPYISQWVVLAIRNLCESNTENKSVIASLQLQGVANNTLVLDEFGVEADVRDSQVVVKHPKLDK